MKTKISITMKKIFLLTIVLFQMTFVFGQYGANKDCAESGCGDKSQNIIRCWGPSRTFGQVPGITIKVKGPIEHCYNAINDEPNRHSYGWWIEVTGKPTVEYSIIITGGDGKIVKFGDFPERMTNTMTFDYKTFSKAESINVAVEALQGNNATSNSTTQQNGSIENNQANNSNSINQNSTITQNNNNNSSNQQSELARVEQRLKEERIESQRHDAERNQAFTEINNKVNEFMQSLPSAKEDKETLDRMKNFELAKLEVEPEFNIISSPYDFKKVSLTTITYQNLDKTGNVAVSIATSALSNVDKAKEKAFTSAKIQTSFLGANTLLVKVIEIGTKNLGGPYAFPTTDIFGTAYTDKKINFDLLKEFIETNKNFKIVQCFSHTINSDDIKIEKCKKINSISDLTKRDDKVKITANIDGVEETSFTVTNFNSKGFTIMHKEEEKKKQKLYNYIIENQ